MPPTARDDTRGLAHLVELYRKAFLTHARRSALHAAGPDGTARHDKSAIRKSIEQVSAALVSQGYLPGERLVVWSEPRIECLVIELGAARVGVAAIPLDPGAGEASRRFREIDPKLVFVSGAARANGAVETLEGSIAGAVDLDAPTATGGAPTSERWEDFLDLGREALRGNPVLTRERVDETSPDDLATIAYDTAEVGPSPGVALTQGNLAASIGNLIRTFDLGPGDVLHLDRPATDLPQRLLAYAVLAEGGTLVFPDPAPDARAAGTTPDGNAREASQPQATLALRTPEQIEAGVRSFREEACGNRRRRKRWMRLRRAAGRRLRRAFEGERLGFRDRLALRFRGASLLRRLRSRFGQDLRLLLVDARHVNRTAAVLLDAAGVDVQLVLGRTETTWLAATNPTARARPETWHLPSRGLEVTVDLDGEILLRGSAVTSGYWQSPNETRRTIENRWYHTGLRGWIEADGTLRISGTQAPRRPSRSAGDAEPKPLRPAA